jgi:hypothetical protein
VWIMDHAVTACEYSGRPLALCPGAMGSASVLSTAQKYETAQLPATAGCRPRVHTRGGHWRARKWTERPRNRRQRASAHSPEIHDGRPFEGRRRPLG